jgi:dipeptidyl-peptidase-4
LTLERDAAKRDATLRRAADPEVPDPELFPVTWMDVDCGSSASARGEREEYLASVAWAPTPSPRERRERASDESAESACRGETPNARDADVSRKRFSFLRGFPNASSRRTLATSDDDASSEMSRHALLVRVQNRAQTQIASIFIDAATGERLTVARDASSMLERVDDDVDAWVNITQNPIVLKKGDPTGGDYAAPGDAVVVSERDGYAHAYLAPVGENRGPPTQLTAGAWCVHRVHAVDEDRGWVYFTANERGPLERHLYRARLWPSTAKATAKKARLEVAPPTRLTRAAGCHTVSLDHAFSRFVDVREDLRTPPVAVMRAIPRSSEDDDVFHETDASTPRNEALAVGEEENRSQRLQGPSNDRRNEGSHDTASTFARVDAAFRATVATYAATYASYKAPSLMRVPAADGVATLYAALYLPDKETFGNGPFPCVVAVYGGPGAQCVVDAWRLTADARAQRLRGRGVATLKLDNRGTANRGCAFERAIRANGAVLGDVEVADQAAGVRFLVEKRIVDPKRVAIVGWSYGGFVAAAALLRAPETFAGAVAGAPVTSWLKYNAHYAERYLGAPCAAGGALRYRRCDLLTFVRERARLDPQRWLASLKPGKKKMLLAHGASDENVHLSHTARLAEALDALDAAAARFHEETETETERNDDAKRRVSSREGVSSFDVAVFARERHVPRGRVARRAFEERVDAFLADAFE